MTRQELLAQINEIFVATLDNDKLNIEENTKAQDIDEWDSLMHVLLVDTIEKHFNIRFKASEIQNWKNIGAIMDSILEKSA